MTCPKLGATQENAVYVPRFYSIIIHIASNGSIRSNWLRKKERAGRIGDSFLPFRNSISIDRGLVYRYSWSPATREVQSAKPRSTIPLLRVLLGFSDHPSPVISFARFAFLAPLLPSFPPAPPPPPPLATRSHSHRHSHPPCVPLSRRCRARHSTRGPRICKRRKSV